MSLATLAFAPRFAPGLPDVQMPEDLAGPLPASAAPRANENAGFDLLTRYIPTETITLYVAAMATREQIAQALGLEPTAAVTAIYLSFALLTPAMLLVLMMTAHRQSGAATRFRARPWPLVAAFTGFIVWALSVPGHPVADQLAGLPALGALVVSTFLSVLDPLFSPRS